MELGRISHKYSPHEPNCRPVKEDNGNSPKFNNFQDLRPTPGDPWELCLHGVQGLAHHGALDEEGEDALSNTLGAFRVRIRVSLFVFY